MNSRALLDSWDRLPRRVYLDTSTLQTIHDYGEHIFEGDPLSLSEHAQRVVGLSDEIWALAAILELNVRGAFQYTVTAAALAEVSKRGVVDYTRWVSEVADLWIELSAADAPPTFGSELQDRRFGMISAKDNVLLQEALDCRCQAFITMERRLATAATFVERHTDLKILRPTEYWELLRPWAALYR